MNNLWKSTFLVVDCETTGHSPTEHRLTEIACVIVNGGEIIQEFSSLINPHQFIPSYIAHMTGISNQMAFNAPEAKDVFPKMRKFLSMPNSVFVAHNVKFDWDFISHYFQQLGYGVPTIPQLCTLKLAKHVLPNNVKKSVGSLAHYFDISLKNAHRALPDARATAKILIELMEIAEKNHNIKSVEELISLQSKKNTTFKVNSESYQKIKRKLLDLPESAGVYKFLDAGGTLIYVGKSNNLYKRVNSYFSSSSQNSRKIQEMINCIDDLEWIDTESELSALVLETDIIEKQKPYFNKQYKHSKKYPFIKITSNELFPSIQLSYDYENDGSEYYGPFRNVNLVESLISIISNNFSITKCKLPEQYGQEIPCSYYGYGDCTVHCSKKIDEKKYKLELENVKQFFDGISNNLMGKFEKLMNDFAENYKYEEAAKMRDQIKDLQILYQSCREMPTSINQNNLIFISPSITREKTVHFILINYGRLIYEKTFGLKADKQELFDKIKDIYYDNKNSFVFNKNNIEEIRLINSWIRKNQENANIFYFEGKSYDKIISEITDYLKLF